MKEQQKQHLINMMKDDEDLGLYDYVGECTGNNGNGCFMDSCGHNCGCFKRVRREETLEEALEKYGKEIGLGNISYIKCAEFGAKWKGQKMYSEQEVINLIKKALIHEPDDEIGALTDGKKYVRENNFNCWFNKYKK